MRHLALAAILCAIPVLSCSGRGSSGDDDSSSPPLGTLATPPELGTLEGSLTLGARTKVLGPGSIEASAYDASSGRIELSASADQIIAGDVLVSPPTTAAPKGFLRKVVAVHMEEGKLVAMTEQAKLADAIESGNVKLGVKLDPTKITAAESVAGVEIKASGTALDGEKSPGLIIGINDLVLIDEDGDTKTKHDLLTLSASLTLDLGIDMTLDVSAFSINELSIVASGAQSGTITVNGAGTTSFEKEVLVIPLNYPPIVIPIAGFPLVFVPSIKFYAGAKGLAQGKFTASATEDTHFRVGLGYVQGSFAAISEGDVQASVQPPSLNGNSASFKGYSNARGEIALYDLAGAYLGLEGFVRLELDASSESCRLGKAGIAGSAGVMTDLFGLTSAAWNKSFEVFSTDLGVGPCNVASGGGDDARLAWVYFPEKGSDSQTLTAPVFAATNDGGLAFARSRNAGVHVAKVDAIGNVDWRTGDPASTSETWRALVATRDGG